jgi:rare lipoprotein A
MKNKANQKKGKTILNLTIISGIIALMLMSSTAHAGDHLTNVGTASWYGNESGTRTANGEHFNPKGLTAAHRSIPIGTRVIVTNLSNNRSVVVRINDHGPAAWTHRVIDVSKGAARKLGFIDAGTARVRISRL